MKRARPETIPPMPPIPDESGGSEPGPLLQHIERQLEAVLLDQQGRLGEAMRYALLNGGKRLRPLLVHAAGQACGARPACLDAPATAVEMIHSYSLVHDDLPAMDDDELRRGRPTCHLAFDEATAILAGDALQAVAFELLAANPHPDPARPARMVRVLAKAAGPAGMAGGQTLDLALTGSHAGVRELEQVHRLKTGALIEASLLLGALATEQQNPANEETCRQLGASLGLAFQIQDDVLDVTGDTARMGKQAGADAARDQPTFVTALGLEAARARFLELYAQARGYSEALPGDRTLLGKVIDLLEERSH